MNNPQQLLQQLVTSRPDISRWLVAYSGGLDSTVLLHSLVRVMGDLNLSVPVIAIHVHHNLSPLADDWLAHCGSTCAALEIGFIGERVELNSPGGSLENAAREARYAAFEKYLQAGDGLLMAHHLDDQAETLLLRLMRGSGPGGLAAMAPERPLAEGTLFRPWLSTSRAEIEVQAASFGLSWIEDDSNQSREFDRNYLRHEVMPLLQQRWPGFAERWHQSAHLCRQSQELINQVAAQDLQRAAPRAERKGYSLDQRVLNSLDTFRRGNVLRFWLEGLGIDLPDAAQLNQIEAQLFLDRSDTRAVVSWGRNRLSCHRQRLYCFEAARRPVPQALPWSGSEPLIWGDWQLTLVAVDEGGFAIAPSGFTVRQRSGGERCQPQWRQHSQTLKKLLQESGLEPWLRDQVPLLQVGGEIVAVGDLWVCRGWSVKSGPGYRLQWQLLDQ